MGLCYHQVVARAGDEELFLHFFGTYSLLELILVSSKWYLQGVLVLINPPEDQVLGFILQVGDFTDEGTSRPGEDSDRVNSWV